MCNDNKFVKFSRRFFVISVSSLVVFIVFICSIVGGNDADESEGVSDGVVENVPKTADDFLSKAFINFKSHVKYSLPGAKFGLIPDYHVIKSSDDVSDIYGAGSDWYVYDVFGSFVFNGIRYHYSASVALDPSDWTGSYLVYSFDYF